MTEERVPGFVMQRPPARTVLLIISACLLSRPCGGSRRNCTSNTHCVSACLQAETHDDEADSSCSSAFCDSWYDECACGTRESGIALRANGVCEVAPSLSEGADACQPAFPHRVLLTLAVRPSPELRPEDLQNGRGSAALQTVLRRCVADALRCQPGEVGALRPRLTGESREQVLSTGSRDSVGLWEQEILWAEVDMEFCVSSNATCASWVNTQEFGERLRVKGQEYAVLEGGTVRVSTAVFAWTTTTTSTAAGGAGVGPVSQSGTGEAGRGSEDTADGGANGSDADPTLSVNSFWVAVVMSGLLGCVCPVLCLHLLWLRHRRGKTSLPDCVAQRMDAWYGSASKTKVSNIEQDSFLDQSLTDEDSVDGDVQDAGDFRPGQTVIIHGLQTAAELNEKEGKCERWDVHSGRWHVRLKGTREVKAFKTANLKALNVKLDLAPKVPQGSSIPEGIKPVPRGASKDEASTGATGTDGLSLTPNATPRDGTPRDDSEAALGSLPGQLACEEPESVLISKGPSSKREITVNAAAHGGKSRMPREFSFNCDEEVAKAPAAQLLSAGKSPSFSEIGEAATSAPNNSSRRRRAPSFSDCLIEDPTASAPAAFAGSSASAPSSSVNRAPSFSDCLDDVQPPPAIAAIPAPPDASHDVDELLSAAGVAAACRQQDRPPSFSDFLDAPTRANALRAREQHRQQGADSSDIPRAHSSPSCDEDTLRDDVGVCHSTAGAHAEAALAAAAVQSTPDFNEETQGASSSAKERTSSKQSQGSLGSVRSTPSFS